MSVLDLPRIYFCGTTTFDPVTTNNYPRNYDEIAAQTVMNPPASGGPGEKDFHHLVKAYRRAAILDVTSGNWNPDGSYRSTFFDNMVVGYDLGKGTCTDDPIVGGPAGFSGMLVDVEPYSNISSQLFFDTISFGIDGGCQVKASASQRMIARQINFKRNPEYNCIAGLASVIWQTSFHKDDLQPLEPRGSQVIACLAEALQREDVQGLTVRWNAYRTVYYDDLECRNGNANMKMRSQELQAKLLEGGFQPNPARSRVVGVLGLWCRTEPGQVPGDRILVPAGPKANDDKDPNGYLASSFVKVLDDRLVIDLSNSTQETGTDLTKFDYGPIQIKAGDTIIATIESTSYDKSAYEASAGIVTCDLTPDQVALARASDLSLHTSTGALLEEQPLRVCELDPACYLNVVDVPDVNNIPQPTIGLQAQVYHRGVIAPDQKVDWVLANASSPVHSTSNSNADGIAVLRIAPAKKQVADVGRIDLYVASCEDPAPTDVDTMNTAYFWVRILPTGFPPGRNPLSDPNWCPSWKLVYESVLYNWNAMAPCMDNWLRLDDPRQILSMKNIVLKLIDAKAFERYRYMPITRDMTMYQRELLRRWLTLADPLALEIEKESSLQPSPEKVVPPSIAQLSRQFRGFRINE